LCHFAVNKQLSHLHAAVSVAVDAISHGGDSITCRDIRYKDEDTSAYRFVERSSAPSDQTTSETTSSAETMKHVTSMETTSAEESVDQPQPITTQQPEIPQPINMQHSRAVDLQQPIVLQQTQLPSECQPQSVADQQAGRSQPVTDQQPEMLQPVTVPEPGLSRPIAMQQPHLSQPVTIPQPDLSQPIAVHQPPLSQPVNIPHADLSRPIAMQQPDSSRPIATQQPPLSQPISIPQPDLSRPIAMHQPDTSRPIAMQQPSLSQPVTIPQPDLSRPITLQQSDSSRPVTTQQPTLSQPVTLHQQESTNSANQSNNNSMPSAASTNFPSSNQQQAMPTGHWYPQSGPDIMPASVPPGSFLTADSPPFQPSGSPQNPQTDSRPIPPPTFMQDFMSRPPPSVANPMDMSGSPVRAARIPMWSQMSPARMMPPVPVPSAQYPLAPAASFPSPGVLCRQPLRSPSPETNRHVQTYKNPVEYLRSLNWDRGQTEKAVQRLVEGVGDGTPPPPFMHPYGVHFPHGYFNIAHMAGAVPQDSQDLRPSSSVSVGYGQRDFGNTEDFDSGAGNCDVNDDTYNEGHYSPHSIVQYLPAPGNPMFTSPNLWPSGAPVREFQPTGEFPVAGPAGRYIYMPQNSAMETQPLMYHMTPGGPQWDMVRGSTVDYTHCFSMPSSLPSAYPLSVPVEGNTVRQDSDFSVDQSAVSAKTLANVDQQSGADVVRSVTTFQQSDSDVTYLTTEGRGDTPESCETIKYDTIAGTFCQGDCVDSFLALTMLNRGVKSKTPSRATRRIRRR